MATLSLHGGSQRKFQIWKSTYKMSTVSSLKVWAKIRVNIANVRVAIPPRKVTPDSVFKFFITRIPGWYGNGHNGPWERPVLKRKQEPPWPSNFPRIKPRYSSLGSWKKGCVSLSMLPCDLSRFKRKWPIGPYCSILQGLSLSASCSPI